MEKMIAFASHLPIHQITHLPNSLSHNIELAQQDQNSHKCSYNNLVYGLQLFAWLEAHCFAGRNIDFSPGARVASDARFARTNIKDSKSTQLNALTFSQGLLHALEHGLHRHFGFGFGDTGFRDYFINDIELDHGRLLETMLEEA